MISLRCIVTPVGSNKSTEARSHWSQPRNDVTKDKAVPINDAPLGILTAHFTNRKTKLVEIGSALTPRPNNLPARCAIVGMPGLGKTQLALKYSLDVFDQARGPMIFWTSAATPEKLAQGLCKILDIVDHVDRDHVDQNVRLSAAQRWLESAGNSFSLPWLLVLDNVSEESVPFLREHLPRSNGHGAILLTMRSIDVASALITSDLNQLILELEVFSLADASNLLLAELQASNPDKTASQIAKAGKLVKSVGCLPLAIGHVASFANQHLKRLDYILHLFENQHAMEVLSWDNHLSNYEQRSVMVTFSSTLDELAAASPVISLLLQMLSLFDPESIALDMIKQGAYPTRDLRAYSRQRKPRWYEPLMPAPKGTLLQLKHRLKQKLRDKLPRRARSSSTIDGSTAKSEASTSSNQAEDIDHSRALEISKLLDDPVEFPKAIQLLRSSSFLSHQCSDDGEEIRIHDLVRSMIRHRARQSTCDSLCFRMAAATVDHVFSAAEGLWSSSEYWPLFERGLPHYRSLVAAQMEQQGCSIDLARACWAVAVYLFYRGRTGEAIKTIKEILPLQEKYHGVNNWDYIRNLSDLGSFLNADYHPDAESILEQSLISIREFLGDTHLGTLRQMSTLASFYSHHGRHDEALALMEKAAHTMKSRFGTEHENTLEDERCLAGLYEQSGRYMEAESLYEKILDTAMKKYGKDNDLTWSTLKALGILKFNLYNLDAADLLLSQADAWKPKSINTHQIIYLAMRCYIGYLRNFQGNYLEAESILKEVLTGYEMSIGLDHVVSVRPMIDLAWFYIDMGRFGDAEFWFLRVVEISEREPNYDLGLGRTLTTLAFVAEQQGRAAEAEAMYKRTMDHRDSKSTEVQFLLAASLSRLLSAQGRTQEAQPLYETALNVLGRYLKWLYRNGIYTTQDAWHQLATIGRILENEEMSEISLRVQEEKIGLAHPMTQKTVQALLKILHKKGKMDKEEALLRRCKDAGIDVAPYLENEKPKSQAGAGKGDNAGQSEGSVATEEHSGEGVVQNVLDSTPGRSAKSRGKMRAT